MGDANPGPGADREAVESFLGGRTAKFDMAAFRRVVLTQMSRDGCFREGTVCGFTKDQISDMAQSPERHGRQILRLSSFMYLKSGYYKRLVNYFANMPKGDCWTVDTEAKSDAFFRADPDALRRGFVRYASLCNSFRMEYEISRIMLNLYLYDACFGYVVESGTDRFIYYFRPEICEIMGSVDGIPLYGIRPGMARRHGGDLGAYPPEIRELIERGEPDRQGRVLVPYEKSFCVKYHDTLGYLYPPLFPLIREILNIEDYKSLEKAKAENDVYKVLALEIPLKDGQFTLGGDVITDFTALANDVISDRIGVLPTPFKVTPVEFSNSNANDINNVQNAIDEAYSEIGVSRALMSGSTSGSELKMSIEIDASDMYRVLRAVSRLVNFHCKIRCGVTPGYGFSFRLLDVTAVNQADRVDAELKMAQASFPNKMEAMAAKGVNPARLLGNDMIENRVLSLGEGWTAPKSSYTEPAGGDGGRPRMDDAEISPAGEQTRDDEGNDADNRA